MSSGLVARRYAKALFSVIGKDLAKGRSLASALETIQELFAQEEAGPILKSPAMPMDLKKNLLDYAIKAGGAPDELKSFCKTVIEAGRVELIPEVIDVFNQLLNDAEGTVEAQITSATPMSPGDQDAIKGLVTGVVGKKVKLSAEIDKDLLGGFIVDVGNYKIDMSLKTRLDGLASEAAAR